MLDFYLLHSIFQKMETFLNETDYSEIYWSFCISRKFSQSYIFTAKLPDQTFEIYLKKKNLVSSTI